MPAGPAGHPNGPARRVASAPARSRSRAYTVIDRYISGPSVSLVDFAPFAPAGVRGARLARAAEPPFDWIEPEPPVLPSLPEEPAVRRPSPCPRDAAHSRRAPARCRSGAAAAVEPTGSPTEPDSPARGRPRRRTEPVPRRGTSPLSRPRPSPPCRPETTSSSRRRRRSPRPTSTSHSTQAGSSARSSTRRRGSRTSFRDARCARASGGARRRRHEQPPRARGVAEAESELRVFAPMQPFDQQVPPGLARRIRSPARCPKNRRVIALVGPPGAGKTLPRRGSARSTRRRTRGRGRARPRAG